MPAEMKKQQLLGSQDVKKRKPKKSQNKTSQQANAAAAAQAQANAKAEAAKAKKQSKPSKFKLYFFGIIIIALIIVPKPQVLVYKKLGLTASSIYIPGWFGTPGKLLDSTQKVILEKQLGLVYLCFGEINPGKQLKEQCNRYQFVEQRGIFSAFFHYRENPTGTALE